MGKLVLTIILCCFNSLALVPENFLQDDKAVITEIVHGKDLEDAAVLLDPKEDNIFDNLINDPKNKVHSDFKVTPFFYHSTKFWFSIYTKYPSSSVVIHDKKHLNIVYEVMEFSKLQNKIKNSHERYLYQNKLVDKEITKYKRAFRNLSLNKKKGALERKILAKLDELKILIPKKKRDRMNYFKSLSSNIRSQTGQRDNISTGIKYYIPFKHTMDFYIAEFDIPKELVAISFLESSFNIRARSKVGASGVWQFMPYIASTFMEINKNVNETYNVLLSTLSAFHLLKQNKKILGTWPLAVAAYNSGTKHFLRAKRQLKNKEAKLEDILKKYDHPHIGFASENFYSEFLALAYTLTYMDYFFKEEYALFNKTKPRIISPYITLCRFRPDHFISILDNNSPMISYYNYHFKNRSLTYPQGQIVFSDITLNKKKYQQIDTKLLTQRYPKNWVKYTKLQKCSIK